MSEETDYFEKFLILILLSIVFYVLYKLHVPMLRCRHIPGPWGMPLVGSALNSTLISQPFKWMLQICDKYGGVCKVHVGVRPIILVTDPTTIATILKDSEAYPKAHDLYHKLANAFGEGLVTSDGEVWEEHHRLLMKWFLPTMREKHMPAINHYTNALVRELKEKCSKSENKSFDLEHTMAEYMLNLFGRIAFNYRFEDNKDKSEKFLNLLASLGPNLARRMLYDIVPGLVWDPPGLSEVKHLIADLTDEYAKGLESEDETGRRNSAATSGDLANMLLNSDLSRQHVLDEVFTLLGAGHETTAALLTFSIYLLSNSPECLAKVRAEIDQVMGDRTDFTYADTLQMEYLNQVFKETMRLYPPVPFIGREGIVDTVVNGVKLPKKTMLLIPLISLNRLERLWPNATEFDPDRFHKSKKIPNGQFIPFSTGKRECVGKNLALMEATVIVAQLVRNFDWKYDTSKSIKLTAAITLRCLTGLYMTATLRK